MVPQQSQLKYSIVDVGFQQFDREEAFRELRAYLKSFKPELKLIYAWLGPGMTNSDLLKMRSIYRVPEEEEIKRMDYIFVYQFPQKLRTGSEMLMYWVESPMLYSPKSLNVFTYYRRQNQLNEYFKDFFRSSEKMKPYIFYQYLEQVEHLSQRKELVDKKTGEKTPNPAYWKNPENSEKVVRAVTKMSEMYRE